MSIYDRDYMRDEVPSLGDYLRRVSAFHWFFWGNIAIFLIQRVAGIGLTHDPVTGEYIAAGAVSLETLTKGHVWTLFTYMFVHGSAGHLLVNMLMLWFAGKRVQDLYGPRHFVLIYVLSGLIGAALQIVISAYLMDEAQISLIGASASVMGLLLAYAIILPVEEITLLLFFVLPVRMRLWNLALFLLGLNVVFGLLDMIGQLPGWLSGGTQVAYFAHVGGALAGWYYTRAIGYGGQNFDLRDGAERRRAMRQRTVARARLSIQRPVVEIDTDAVHRQNPRRDPIFDLMQDEVDPILDKISDQGLNSLTDDERRILERASRKISRDKP
ncbi:MAG: hypothetical protein RL015_3228 [Verrucomicrobiota bacterium]|jgi:membrane associated rhomboid family serine protease